MNDLRVPMITWYVVVVSCWFARVYVTGPKRFGTNETTNHYERSTKIIDKWVVD